jgi:hypothetical protein
MLGSTASVHIEKDTVIWYRVGFRKEPGGRQKYAHDDLLSGYSHNYFLPLLMMIGPLPGKFLHQLRIILFRQKVPDRFLGDDFIIEEDNRVHPSVLCIELHAFASPRHLRSPLNKVQDLLDEGCRHIAQVLALAELSLK